MRILEVGTEFGVGGIARHVIDLSNWLGAAGHDVFIAGGPDALLDESKDPRFRAVPIARVSVKGGSLGARVANVGRNAAALRRIIRETSPDIIHCHESAPAIVARLAALGTGIPIAVTYHGSEPERIRAFGTIGRLSADMVITPSHRCAEELERIGGVPREKLRVVGLGVEPAPAVDPVEVARLRSDLLGEDGRLLVTLLARTSYQKGIDILIEVAGEVLKSRTDVRFVVAGYGPLFEEMQALAQKRGVERQVRLIGSTPHPYHYLHAADLFLLTSRWEALPISIVEAFRAGRPVIAPDTGGVSELVDGEVGAVVPVGDVGGFTREILRLGADEGLRKRLGAAALERSRAERFKPDVMHRRIEELYLSLVQPREGTNGVRRAG